MSVIIGGDEACRPAPPSSMTGNLCRGHPPSGVIA
jgi:hypothetical protein